MDHTVVVVVVADGIVAVDIVEVDTPAVVAAGTAAGRVPGPGPELEPELGPGLARVPGPQLELVASVSKSLAVVAAVDDTAVAAVVVVAGDDIEVAVTAEMADLGKKIGCQVAETAETDTAAAVDVVVRDTVFAEDFQRTAVVDLVGPLS